MTHEDLIEYLESKIGKLAYEMSKMEKAIQYIQMVLDSHKLDVPGEYLEALLDSNDISYSKTKQRT